ncbi:MAG: Rieske 2Fe-2S domain-containing protein [Myxococcota bacterium]
MTIEGRGGEFARGWYLALYADALPCGAVRALDYLGQRLVAWRGEDGVAAMADAYCPHLGAHLGVGGRVVGGSLACPFHGWEFDAAGVCRHIAYAKRIPAQARLRPYPVVERNGALWFWFDPARGEPDFEVPSLPEWGSAEWGSDWHHSVWTVRAHPLDILENGIDWPHSAPVHGFDAPRGVYGFEGPLYRWGADTGKTIDLLDAQREDFRFRVETWGLGLSHVHYDGLFSVLFQIGQTPIDAQTTRIAFSILTRARDRDDAEIGPALARYVADNIRTFEQDFPIWEHKVRPARPLLCDGDGPIQAFRRWADQFYAPRPSPGERPSFEEEVPT